MEKHTGEVDSSLALSLIQALSEKLLANYIFPEIAGEISTGLQKHLEAGDYAGIDEGEFLALALTLHMQEVNHDEHLWVRWHPEALPEDDGQLRLNPQWQAERQLEARLDNYGFHKVERLGGNIGYLDIRYFHRPEWAGAVIAAAMSLVADTQALVLDLRKCTGGFPATVALVCSHLFGEQSLLLNSIHWHDDNTTQEFWTQPLAPGKHFGDRKPIYVLTSRATFSAGELCTGVLQSRRGATVLGERTDGGSHPGASYRLHPHFEIFIPIGRSIDPLTGTDWEGKGLTPDFPLPREQAFTAAFHMALKAVLSVPDGPPTGPYRTLAREAQSALDELESNWTFCPRCVLPNPRHRPRCQRCDEKLAE